MCAVISVNDAAPLASPNAFQASETGMIEKWVKNPPPTMTFSGA
jgi:hypothetical protein